MPVSDICGLRAALENIRREPDIVARHQKIAARVRRALTSLRTETLPGGRFLWHGDGVRSA